MRHLGSCLGRSGVPGLGAVCLIVCLALLPLRTSAAPLLIMGDSISAGYGLSTEEAWVSLLQERLAQQDDDQLADVEVVNASISGETTSGGLNRLPELLERYQPAWVIIELGGNDGLRGTPLNVVKSNLSRMVQLSQSAGARVMLLGMRIPPNYGPRYTEAFYQLFADVAAEYGTVYHPFFLEGVGGVRQLMQSDGIHPNQQAQLKLLDNIWPDLRTLLQTAPAG